MNADTWNKLYPVGTLVRAFPNTRQDPPRITRTRSAAWDVQDGLSVVKVDGCTGEIGLDNVDPMAEDFVPTTAAEAVAVLGALPMPVGPKPQTLSAERLAEIAGRAEAATPGPWCTDSWEIYQGSEYEPGISQWIGETCRGTTTLEQDRADAAFVAAARTDVPALLADNEYLRARIAELEQAAEEIRHLHKDSPMGPCPVCIDADAMVRGDDYTLPYPCPTARLAGAKDFDPPSQRAAETDGA